MNFIVTFISIIRILVDKIQLLHIDMNNKNNWEDEKEGEEVDIAALQWYAFKIKLKKKKLMRSIR